ncbi:MAG: DUF3604 domain-containing protein, partial [Promethearchaeota archaeon]
MSESPDEIGQESDRTVKYPKFIKALEITWQILRPILYIASVWTIFIYFWNFTGILFGAALVIFSKVKAWRRHGIFLVFTLGIGAYLLNSNKPLYFLLVVLILLVYVAVMIIEGIVKLIQILIRLKKKQPKKTSSRKANIIANKPARLAVRIAVAILPLIIWSTVNINFRVMFVNKTQMLWVHAPTTGNVGENLDILVEAWDDFERVSGSYRGTVDFFIRSYNLTTGDLIASPSAILPSTYTFTGKSYSGGIVPAYELSDKKDFGMKTFTAQISTPGIHYILVDDDVTGNTYWSNPIMVDSYAVGTPKILWGDIHGHTSVSDGSGTVDHSYRYARYVAGLEFCSVTDHGEHLNLNGYANDGSRYLDKFIEDCNEAYAPGEFVALQGIEWTTGYVIQPIIFIPTPIGTGGHYTMVFSGDDVPLVAANTQTTPDQLWDVLDEYTSSSGEETIAVPHHTIRNQFIQDWTYLNPDYVRLAEVSSVHGECLFNNELNYRGSVDVAEKVNGSSIIEAINMGYRMTFISSGDNHDGHPGHSISHTEASIGHQWPYTMYHARNGHPYPSGITAVYASDLTRTSVFDGLQNGLVYSNSDHGRPILNLTINGVGVAYNSTVIVPTNTTARELQIFIAQDGAPAATLNTAAEVSASWVPNWAATVEIIKNGELWDEVDITTPF